MMPRDCAVTYCAYSAVGCSRCQAERHALHLYTQQGRRLTWEGSGVADIILATSMLAAPPRVVAALKQSGSRLGVQALGAGHGRREVEVVRPQSRDGRQWQQRLQSAGAGRHAQHERHRHATVHLDMNMDRSGR